MTAPSAQDVRRAVLADVDAERAALVAREARAREDMRALSAEAERITTEHDAACADARARHVAMPPAPMLPDSGPLQELAHRLILERGTFSERERQVLARAADAVEEAWQDGRPGLDSQAADLLLQVDALAARYRDWHRLVRDARHARETANPNARTTNGPSTRMRPAPDAVAVLTVAAHGADLLAPAPLPPRPAPVSPGRHEPGFGTDMLLPPDSGPLTREAALARARSQSFRVR